MDLAFSLILLGLYVLPTAIGILLLYWAVKKFGTPRKAKVIRNILFALLGIAFIGVHFWDWASNHHYFEFSLGEKYDVEMSVVEINSFIDCPVDFELEVFDKTNRQIQEFEFSSDGPYYEFLISSEDEFWIRGYDRCALKNWIIDLDGDDITQHSPENIDDFILCAELSPSLELVVK
jgi:hypothetical protein